MITDEGDERIALQPETPVEQSLLSEMFTRLANLGQQEEHPEKLGSKRVFYTLDIPEYDGLDHELWEFAECGVSENGRLDPEPGSRALVVVHGENTHEGNSVADEPDTVEDDSPADEEVAFEDGLSKADVAERADELIEQYESDEEVEYEELQECAKDASTLGFDIPANQSTADIVDDLRVLVSQWEVKL